MVARVAECAVEPERHHLRELIANAFQDHRRAAQEERAKYIVKFGRAFPKSKKLHNIEGLRAILLLPAVLIIAEAVGAAIVKYLIDSSCPAPSGVMFGARKGTQVLDLAFAAQLQLQGDNHGPWGSWTRSR